MGEPKCIFLDIRSRRKPDFSVQGTSLVLLPNFLYLGSGDGSKKKYYEAIKLYCYRRIIKIMEKRIAFLRPEFH